MQSYVLNTWYMVGWAEEITTDLLSRKILGKAVLLTRDENGAPIALRDQCPHRFALLSQGRRVSDRIVCGFHGLEFDGQGRCVKNPYSDRIPARASVTRYSAFEKDDIVWVWFGDPTKADPALIPDFTTTVAGPNGTRINGCTFMQANYEYGTDNLLDNSHIEFVHTGTFAGNGVIFRGECTVEQVGNQVHVNWWMPGVKCPTGLDALLKIETVDHWLDMRWDPPGVMYLQVGATPPGQPREVGAKFEQAHILTPADLGETHYFWSSNSRYPIPPERSSGFREMLRRAFELEDKPMVEASYHNVEGDFWDQQPVSLGIDAGGTRARRIIQALKQAESPSA
jgi:vanillate O-demethylase monooxygenase subunit